MKQKLSPYDVQKRLKHMAHGLLSNTISEDEKRWLSAALIAISEGAEATEVLGMKYGRGQKKTDSDARTKHSQIFHWVACAMDSDTGHGYSLERALEESIKHFQYEHDLDYLREKWHDYKHMQSAERHWSDPDSPFEP